MTTYKFPSDTQKDSQRMISDPPLYRGSGGGVKAHSIRRRKITPPVRQRTLPESPVTARRPQFTRQRSLSPSRILDSPQRTPRRHMSYTDIVTTNRRLVLALDQFTSTALPFYLELLARFTHKIQRVRKTILASLGLV